MGNEFLSHIQSVDGIFHVVRAFDDEEIQHYEGEVDPVRDMEIIQGELMEKDKVIINKNIDELDKVIKRSNGKAEVEECGVLKKVLDLYSKNINVRDAEWNFREIDILNKYYFFTSKPFVYLVNMSEADYIAKKNKYLGKIKKWIDSHGGGEIIPYSAAFELKWFGASDEEKTKITKDNGGATSCLPKIIKAGYHNLSLIHFFTAGEDEVKCWTIRAGTKAPGAAGTIHTDFERGFISAEVMKYDDLLALGNESNVKKEGKVRTEGKTYEVLDGDIIYFKFNVSDPSKKKK